MSLLSRLGLLFVGVPLLELFLLVQLGQWVGLWPTVGLVALTGFAGAALARWEGLRTVWRVSAELSKGRLPGSALLDGLAVLVGGALLLTPGILTDLLGFSLLLPPTRRVILRRIRVSVERRLKDGTIHFTVVSGGPGGGSGDRSGWGKGAWTDAVRHEEGERSGRPGEIIVEKEGDGRGGD